MPTREETIARLRQTISIVLPIENGGFIGMSGPADITIFNTEGVAIDAMTDVDWSKQPELVLKAMRCALHTIPTEKPKVIEPSNLTREQLIEVLQLQQAAIEAPDQSPETVASGLISVLERYGLA